MSREYAMKKILMLLVAGTVLSGLAAYTAIARPAQAATTDAKRPG